MKKKEAEKKIKKMQTDRAKAKGYWCCEKRMNHITSLYGGESECSCCSFDSHLYQCSKCKTIKVI